MRTLLLLSIILLLQACSSFGPLQSARSQFKAGDADGAYQSLESAKVGKRDRLLLHLDRGMVAQSAGRYQQSIEAFAKAQNLIEELDFVSVSEQGAALLANDWTISYRGEYSERLWINTFQMMNYLLIDKPESAAVEARRALKVIESHPDVLEDDIVSRLLMAISFEAAGQYDSAAVEYRKLFADAPTAAGIAESAWRNARRFGRSDEAKRYAARLTTESKQRFARDEGELIVLVANGFIPEKVPGDLFVNATTRISFPYYPPSWSNQLRITASANGLPADSTVTSLPLVDLSRASLNDRGKRIGARQVARVVGKLAVQDAIQQSVSKSAGDEVGQIIGGLTSVLLFVLEQADTRSWETLPRELALLRIPLAAGEHTVSLRVNGGITSDEVVLQSVAIKAGRQSFRLVRDGQLIRPSSVNAGKRAALLTQATLDVDPAQGSE